jgi:hypothetical protein
MTPKEKAQNLVNEFYRIIPLDKMTLDFNLAKQCALIAVDKILNAVNDPDETYLMKDSVDYWGKVKKEIKAL